MVFQWPPATLPKSHGRVGHSQVESSTCACLQAVSPGFSARRKIRTGQMECKYFSSALFIDNVQLCDVK